MTPEDRNAWGNAFAAVLIVFCIVAGVAVLKKLGWS